MTNDPFAEIRGKTMGELTPEQHNLAIELWAREQRMSFTYYYRDLFDHVFKVIDRLRAPIDMMLRCPACGLQHVDRRDPPLSAEWDDAEAWTNPPHRSHLCRGCGHVWRPADVPTNGVASIKTTGKKDSPLPTLRSDDLPQFIRNVRNEEGFSLVTHGTAHAIAEALASAGWTRLRPIVDMSLWPAPDGSAEVVEGTVTVGNNEGQMIRHVDAWSGSLVRQIAEDAVRLSSGGRTDQTPPEHQAHP